MRKIIIQAISILMVLLVFTFTGCQKVDLYQAGLEMTVLMGEMVENDDYANLLIGNYSEVDIGKVRAKDYDTPVKVYNISQSTFEKTIEELSKNGSTFKETYEKLPDSLKEQLKQRINFSSVINLNNQSSSNFEQIVLANNFVAQRSKKGTIKQETAYLYIFETGKPIIVLFTPITNEEYRMVGMFFMVEECETLSEVRTLFEPYGCEVSIVK